MRSIKLSNNGVSIIAEFSLGIPILGIPFLGILFLRIPILRKFFCGFIFEDVFSRMLLLRISLVVCCLSFFLWLSKRADRVLYAPSCLHKFFSNWVETKFFYIYANTKARTIRGLRVTRAKEKMRDSRRPKKSAKVASSKKHPQK